MTSESTGASEGDGRLNIILAEFIQQTEAGMNPDPQEFIARHPEFAEELQEFFGDKARFDHMAEPFKPGVDPSPQHASVDATLLSSDAQSNATSTRVPSIGSKLRYFGDYELLEEIARGGMGVVYKARQSTLKRIVALKMILTGQLAGSDDVKRFYAEAEAAAKLEHPNIVPIFEIGQAESQHYFSMSFVEGESLAQRVVREVIAPKEAAKIMHKVALAIAYAHVEGVVHRDLKPANILLDKSGDPHVTDFGLAKTFESTGEASDSASNLTATGQVLGTPSYMPPEQARGGAKEIGPLADVYSLGAVLYCLITGRPPFQAASPLDTLLQVIERDPVGPRSLNPAVPRDLETICLKCLEKDPARRYGSAKAFADDVERWLRGEPIQARPAGVWERTLKWAKRRPATMTVLGVTAVAILCLLYVGGALWLSTLERASLADALEGQVEQTQTAHNLTKGALAKAEQAERDEAAARKKAERQAADRLFEQSLAKCLPEDPRVGLLWLVRSLDEATKIGAPDLEQSCRRQLAAWSRNLHPPRFVLPSGITTPVLNSPVVAYSSNGSTFLAGDQTQFQRWDSKTGKPLGSRATLEFQGQKCAMLAFHPNGQIAVTTYFNNSAQLWDVATAKPIGSPLKHPDQGRGQMIRIMAFSPDGKRLVTSSEDGSTRLWDIAAEKFVEIVPEGNTAFTNKQAATFSADGETVLLAYDLKSIQLFDGRTGERRGPVRDLGEAILGMAVSPDGKMLLTGHYKKVSLWDLEAWKPRWTGIPFAASSPSEPNVAVAFSHDGKMAAAGDSQAVRLWDVRTGQPLGLPMRLSESFSLSGEQVSSLAFSPDDRAIVVSGASYMVRVWELAARGELGVCWHHPLLIRAIFSPDGTTVLTSSQDNKARLWDAATGEPLPATLQHPAIQAIGQIWALAYSPDGKTVLTGCNDGTARLWKVESGEPIGAPMEHPDMVMSVAYHPDGKTCATASYDGTVLRWDTTTGQRVGSSIKHPEGLGLWSIQFSRSGKTLLGCYRDESARLWEVETGKLLGVDNSGIQHAFFSPDGKSVWTGAPQRNTSGMPAQRIALREWDANTAKPLKPPLEVEGGSLTFNPDLSQAVSVRYMDNTVWFWDPQSGKSLGSPLTLGSPFAGFAFSPDGRLLLTGSWKESAGDARLWDVETRKQVGPAWVHGGLGAMVAFSPDGKTMLMASGDGTVLLRKIPEPVVGTPERLSCWIQVLTGLELEENGLVRVLNADAWQQRQQRLNEPDGKAVK